MVLVVITLDHLLYVESTPCDVLVLVMHPVHGDMADPVLGPHREVVGEDNPLAVALHQVVVTPLWRGRYGQGSGERCPIILE